jgi:CHU_C Type IX secretion signal domain
LENNSRWLDTRAYSKNCSKSLKTANPHMRTLLTITLIIQSLHLMAQPANLVPNGGFEVHTHCPDGLSGIQIVGAPAQGVMHWFKPTNGTPDYFNTCSNNKYSDLPTNLIGHTEPKDGQACAGIALLYLNSETYKHVDYREYLCVRLRTPMEAGHTYCVGMYATPAERMNTNELCTSFPDLFAILGTRSLGIHLSDTLVLDTIGASNWYINTGIKTLPSQPQVEATEVMTDTTRWYSITGIYTAQGGEEWLTIGNFKNDSLTFLNSQIIREGAKEYCNGLFDPIVAYYFIDHVFAYDLAVPSIPVFAAYPTKWCVTDFPDTLTTIEPIASAVWSTGDINTDRIEISEPGWYTVQGTVHGCPITDSVEVVVEEPLDIMIDAPRQIANCDEEGNFQSIIMGSTAPLPNYTWNLFLPGQRNDALVRVNNAGTQVLYSTNSCGTFSDSVQILGCDPGPLYIPNAIAPGSGDDNAFFSIFGNNILVQDLQIYDVWGHRVYHATGDIGLGWDGTTSNGEACPPGVYMWVLQYKTWSFKATKTLTGDVTLIR